MKKLLKSYNFNNSLEYYEMITGSVINGQRTQAKEQFNAMPKMNKKDFIHGIFGQLESGLSEHDKHMFIDEL